MILRRLRKRFRSRQETKIPAEQDVLADFQATLASCRKARLSSYLNQSLNFWENDSYQRSYASTLRNALATKIADFHGSQGLDFGCWTAFSSYMMALYGARLVVGIDVAPGYVNAGQEWLAAVGERRLTLVTVDIGKTYQFPLPDAFFDWISLTQVWGSLNPDSIEGITDELVRVLRPGGTIYLNDSNNPHCLENVRRLLADYNRLELGTGHIAAPNGDLFRERAGTCGPCSRNWRP